MSDSRDGLFLELAVPQNSGSSETGGKWDGERSRCLESRHCRVCVCVSNSCHNSTQKAARDMVPSAAEGPRVYPKIAPWRGSTWPELVISWYPCHT